MIFRRSRSEPRLPLSLASIQIDTQPTDTQQVSEPALGVRTRGAFHTGDVELDNYLRRRRKTYRLRHYGGPILALLGVLVAAILIWYCSTRR